MHFIIFKAPNQGNKVPKFFDSITFYMLWQKTGKVFKKKKSSRDFLTFSVKGFFGGSYNYYLTWETSPVPLLLPCRKCNTPTSLDHRRRTGHTGEVNWAKFVLIQVLWKFRMSFCPLTHIVGNIFWKEKGKIFLIISLSFLNIHIFGSRIFNIFIHRIRIFTNFH